MTFHSAFGTKLTKNDGTIEFIPPVKVTKELKIRDAVNDDNPITKKSLINVSKGSITAKMKQSQNQYFQFHPNSETSKVFTNDTSYWSLNPKTDMRILTMKKDYIPYR